MKCSLHVALRSHKQDLLQQLTYFFIFQVRDIPDEENRFATAALEYTYEESKKYVTNGAEYTVHQINEREQKRRW